MRALICEIRRDEKGSALLEATVLVPVLFVLVFGVLEFSFYFYQHHLVSTGVRDAARYLARTDPSSGAAQTIAQNLAATGSAAGGSARRVAGFDPGEVNISFTTISNAPDGAGIRPYREASPECTAGPDTLLIVNVTGSFTPARTGFWGFLGFAVPAITVTHRERCIGQT